MDSGGDILQRLFAWVVSIPVFGLALAFVLVGLVVVLRSILAGTRPSFWREQWEERTLTKLYILAFLVFLTMLGLCLWVIERLGLNDPP